MSDQDCDLNLGGNDSDEVDFVVQEQLEFASSFAESLNVFMERLEPSSLGVPGYLSVVHHFMDVLAAREVEYVCPECGEVH